MIILISVFTLAHVFFYLILAWKWRNIQSNNHSQNHRFSVVIAARNEEANIEKVLGDLSAQSYPQDMFEVIVVDDFSDDDTVARVKRVMENSSMDLKVIQLENKDRKGKKHALTKGIESAAYELILTTDADCRMNHQWIASYDRIFSDDTHIVAGPVSLTGDGMFAAMQKTEFAGLVAFGAVTLISNNPSMCSGANLGFRKKTFSEVGGYQSNIKIPSGDDEFLLYDIMHLYPKSGRFIKSKDALVSTPARDSFSTFFNQRSRWASKWRYNKNRRLHLLTVLFFSDYLILLIGVFNMIKGTIPSEFIALILGTRFASNYMLLKLLAPLMNLKRVFVPLFWLQIFYPFHVLFMGVVSIFGRYTWKGRKY